MSDRTVTNDFRLRDETPVSDKDLIKAISLRFDRHFPAMNLANGLGGLETIPWLLVRRFSALDLLNEAKRRGIQIDQIPTAMEDCPCCPRLVKDSSLMKNAIEKHGFQP